jgi:N-methylhydantoinase B/oxoprolinase/acetone carboxylase alpha subunit
VADEPSASELERLIERNHRETSADILDLKSQLTANVSTIITQFDRYVLAAVYEANERARDERDRAQDAQIAEIKDELTSARRASRGAITMGAASFLAALAVAVVVGFMKGAGH